jgi:myo-inositol-1(or 4)-monophosphatase
VSLPFRLETLLSIAEAAGAVARTAGAGPMQIVDKADGSPVTIVDREVNDFLHRELIALVPGSGWLSEETADHPSRLHAPLVWIVDPIDGTQQLVRGIPEVAISIGLVDRSGVVAAAIVNPATGERGAWVEGEALAFSGLVMRPPPRTLDDATAIVSLSESEAGELAFLSGIVGTVRPVGSAAYKLLRVAAGADALTYSIRPKSEWDVCAGVGLVRAAGMSYVRLDGLPVAFNQPEPRIASGAVAGPSPLAAELRERINRKLAARRA